MSARRFCGDVIIDVSWRDFEGGYWKTRVRCAGAGINVKVAYGGFAHSVAVEKGVNHPDAIDAAAYEALCRALESYDENEAQKIADAAACGIVDGKYKILRAAKRNMIVYESIQHIPRQEPEGYEGI